MITYLLLCIAWLCLIEIVDKPNATMFKLRKEYPVSLRKLTLFWLLGLFVALLLAPLAFASRMYVLATTRTFKEDPELIVASTRKALRVL